MIAATRYPAFSRNFEDEQDYADAAVSAARKANSLPSGVKLAPILRWKRRQQQHGDSSSVRLCLEGSWGTSTPMCSMFFTRR